MTHVNISRLHPQAYEAVMTLNGVVEGAASSAGLDPALADLVKIRASQLNGCAFCLRMHAKEAAAHGVEPEKLAVVAAWWESQYFSEAERAALSLAERVTLQAAPDRFVDRGVVPGDHLSPEQVSAVTWLVVVINAWNRIAVESHYPVAPAR